MLISADHAGQSATCVPASSLLDPVFKPGACPLGQERFELRTRALGCGCSTATLLSVIVTVLGTIVALLLFYAIVLSIRALNRTYGTGSAQGWEVEISDDGSRKGKPWARPSWTATFRKLFHRKSLASHSEREEITERSRLLPCS